MRLVEKMDKVLALLSENMLLLLGALADHCIRPKNTIINVK